MRILNVRPGGGRPILLYFDLELEAGDVRVIDLYLKRNLAGDLRVYAPSPGSRRLVTFTKEFSEAIIAAAEAQTGGRLGQFDSAA